MSSTIAISVISNSRLGALSHACALAEEHWGMSVSVALFSTLPLADLALPHRLVRYYRLLPARPQVADYKVLAADTEFANSAVCLLFLTRLVPECVYSSMYTINFHPSLLPEHPGLSGYASAIDAGQLAVSAHRVDSSIDGGSILRQYSIVPFPQGADAAALQQESSLMCSAAILSILRALPAVARQQRQDFASGTHCIDSILSAEAIV